MVRAARQMTTIAPATAAHWAAQALRLLGEQSRLRPELWLQQADALGLAGRLRESRLPPAPAPCGRYTVQALNALGRQPSRKL